MRIVTSGRVFVLTATEGYLGEMMGIEPLENQLIIVLRSWSFVGNTGQRNVFESGTLDTNSEVEVAPPEAVKCIPMTSVISWGTWPGTLPTTTR